MVSIENGKHFQLNDGVEISRSKENFLNELAGMVKQWLKLNHSDLRLYYGADLYLVFKGLCCNPEFIKWLDEKHGTIVKMNLKEDKIDIFRRLEH